MPSDHAHDLPLCTNRGAHDADAADAASEGLAVASNHHPFSRVAKTLIDSDCQASGNPWALWSGTASERNRRESAIPASDQTGLLVEPVEPR